VVRRFTIWFTSFCVIFVPLVEPPVDMQPAVVISATPAQSAIDLSCCRIVLFPYPNTCFAHTHNPGTWPGSSRRSLQELSTCRLFHRVPRESPQQVLRPP
jgi:hypothetical protein